jgi:flavin reductase (DIM6/NTAB) family NADH-FMN oxidoreductase RutF
MDDAAKKIALRMIPYGLYVLTTECDDGRVAASTVNWVTQASFEPPLVVVGVKVDSQAHGLIKEKGSFALNVLGKGHQSAAFAFFKPPVKEGQTLSGEGYRSGATGSPILDSAPAFLECELIESLDRGDHSIFVGKVVEAGVRQQPEGRPDDATLWLKELGESVFYGG